MGALKIQILKAKFFFYIISETEFRELTKYCSLTRKHLLQFQSNTSANNNVIADWNLGNGLYILYFYWRRVFKKKLLKWLNKIAKRHQVMYMHQFYNSDRKLSGKDVSSRACQRQHREQHFSFLLNPLDRDGQFPTLACFGTFGHHFSTFRLLCLAKDHWRGFSTLNAHMVHIVN